MRQSTIASLCALLLVPGSIAAALPRAEDQIFTCVLPGCPEDSALICEDGSQYCTHPNSNPDENWGNDFAPIPVYRACANSTLAPEYPITDRCESTLQPFDASQLPEGCSSGHCLMLTMMGRQWYVMCWGPGEASGLVSTGMECPS